MYQIDKFFCSELNVVVQATDNEYVEFLANQKKAQ